MPFAGRSPQHIGYLVHDVGAMAETLKALPGCETSEPFTLDITADVIEVGREGSLRIMLARMGTALLEFIEPQGDSDNVWSQALSRRGPGVHHVAFTQIENYDQNLETMQALGFDLSVAGHFGTDRWCYLEQADLVIELANGTGPVFPDDEEQRR